jgi:putative membrane protein
VRLLISYLILAIAVTAAVILIPGITIEGTNAWITVLVTALILGVLNLTLGPLLKLLSCGCIIATFGLFAFVINGFILWLSSQIAQEWFDIDFIVDGFWPAFWGGLVISIVATLLDWFARRGDETTPAPAA